MPSFVRYSCIVYIVYSVRRGSALARRKSLVRSDVSEQTGDRTGVRPQGQVRPEAGHR